MSKLTNQSSKRRVSKDPMVSILMLNYNGRRYLGSMLDECVSSILNTTYPNFEVLFLDNGSVDDSVSYVLSRYGRDAKLKVIKLGRNYGYAKGNNLGVEFVHEHSKYLAFLNNDVIVKPSWLSWLIELLEKDSLIGATQPLILFGRRGEKLHAGGYLGLSAYPLVIHSRYDGEITYPSGSAFVIRADLFKEMKGFDESFYLFWEEIDLGWRLWLRNYKIVTCSKAIVHHLGGVTVKKALGIEKMFFHRVKSRYIFIFKNFPLKLLLKAIPYIIMHEILDIGISLYVYGVHSLIGKLKGFFWIKGNLKALVKKRMMNRPRKFKEVPLTRRLFYGEARLKDLMYDTYKDT